MCGQTLLKSQLSSLLAIQMCIQEIQQDYDSIPNISPGLNEKESNNSSTCCTIFFLMSVFIDFFSEEVRAHSLRPLNATGGFFCSHGPFPYLWDPLWAQWHRNVVNLPLCCFTKTTCLCLWLANGWESRHILPSREKSGGIWLIDYINRFSYGPTHSGLDQSVYSEDGF